MKATRSSTFQPGSLDAAGKAIQRRAAEWLARREAQGFSLAEQADFADWLAADARHAAIFAEVESSWRAFDRLAAYPHSVDVAADPDLLAPAPVERRTFVLRCAVGLAASIAIGAILWVAPWRGSDERVPAVAQTDARFLRLSDGSTVELNAGSVVTEHFTSTQRRLRLVRGEAHFSVTKDPTREFIVEADGVAVRAVGTAFNVLIKGPSVEVIVTEGTVRVAPPIPNDAASSSAVSDDSPSLVSATLVAGQRTIVPAVARANPASPVIETLGAADIDRALAWQTSRFRFDSTPLSEVIRQLNHNASRQEGAPHLSVRDAKVGAILVSGRVRSDNIESFVEALESSFGVVADRRADGEIVLRSAERN